MAKSHLLRLLIAAAAVAAFAISTEDAGEDFNWTPANNPSTCKGSIGECMADGEFEMDSESSRRILATKTYISYDALRAGSTPCSHKGASYYNCQPGAQANPFTRTCNQVTRCGRG